MSGTLTPTSLGGLRVEKVKDKMPYLNFLVYGDPGVGKTELAGSADDVPSMRKVLFLDVEGGTFTLRQHHESVDVIRISSWQQMQDAYNALFAGGHDYQTVVLDSLTEMQKFSMYGIMGRLIKEFPDRDPDVPGMREWGQNIEQMRRMIRAFRDLPMNVIFTALMKSDRNPRSGLSEKKPSMSGKVANEVAGFLDIVCYYYMKEVEGEQKRLLLSGSTDEVVAKDRSGKLPLVIESPTMSSIMGYVMGASENTNTEKESA